MYGSASDRRKGDGAEIPASFPVYSEMEVLFKQPLGTGVHSPSLRQRSQYFLYHFKALYSQLSRAQNLKC